MSNSVFLFCFSLAQGGQEIGGALELFFEHFLRFQHRRTFRIKDCVTYFSTRFVGENYYHIT